MNRFSSAVAVLALVLLADVICVRQTLAVRQELGDGTAMLLLGLESISAIVMLVISATLTRKQFYQPAKISRPISFEASRQLRRLLATVWS